MEFYSVKHRKKVDVNEKDVSKKTFGEGNRLRYAAIADTTVDGDQVKLTRFISKTTYDELKVAEDKGNGKAGSAEKAKAPAREKSGASTEKLRGEASTKTSSEADKTPSKEKSRAGTSKAKVKS